MGGHLNESCPDAALAANINFFMMSTIQLHVLICIAVIHGAFSILVDKKGKEHPNQDQPSHKQAKQVHTSASAVVVDTCAGLLGFSCLTVKPV